MAQEHPYAKAIVNLTSEGQYNLTNNKANFVNLLEVGINANLGHKFTFTGNFITVQNTRSKQGKGRISDDFQVFSNIEEDNHKLSLFTFGPTWKVTDNLNLFIGVRNVNLDYFASPLTSVFTGSSQGIYPTISGNWEKMANYPMSAMCFHADWDFTENWNLRNSLYNGTATLEIQEVFRFIPTKNGIFNITQLGYTYPGEDKQWLGEYYIGFTYGNAPNQENVKTNQYSAFGLIEQPLVKDKLGLLLEYGWSPKSQTCRSYLGAAFVFTNFGKENADLGVMINRAAYKEGKETDIEITYSIPISQHITIQPCMHFIQTNKKQNTIGLVRLNICL